MGGAGIIFDNLGINMVSIIGKSAAPSVLYLNRVHGAEIEISIEPVNAENVWREGRKGIYSMTDFVYEKFGSRYSNDPRILATGPAAQSSDIGAICSVPIVNKQITFVDTWAGRGGFGTKLFREHGIAAVIYGGTFIDEDFRDRKVADEWFVNKYQKKLAAKDFESTTKYRFDPNFNTGGTFGVNYSTLKGKVMAFNYKSIYMEESERLDFNDRLITNHYLKQFNSETIDTKQFKTCGEPCPAVCKKMNGEFKKDYEPYQTMGPLCGIFDQRAAEKVNHHADMLGYDGISIGGVVSWLFECLDNRILTPEELGVSDYPVFKHNDLDPVNDSMKNADLAIAIIDSITHKRGLLNMEEGARKLARHLARKKGKKIMDGLVYCAFGRKGWMVPNQYWTPGVLSPMAIMGKYYMYYGNDFVPPRQLGRMNADRFVKELIMDNLGVCRFHRNWAEEMMPDIIESLYGLKDKFLQSVFITASKINSRNSSIYWETERCIDYVYTFLKRKRDVENDKNTELADWIDRFEKDKKEEALQFWYEIHKGIHESLREFD